MTARSVDKGTISVRLVGEALREWRAQGRDASALLSQAEIAPELLDKPYARVSAQAYARLWLLLAKAMDDEFFGMNARRMKSGSYAFMARSALKEPSLGAALDNALAFLSLVFDDLTLRLEHQAGLAAIVIDEPPGQACRAFGCFTLWIIVHGLACWLLGRRIPILAVELRCPQPDYLEDYRVMFSANLRFARPHSRLLFNADCLAQPLRRSERELKRFLAGAPANILVRYRDPQSHAARIKAYLRNLKAERWPDFEALSGHFYMAPSTLRRKLALEGQSYQGLKDQVRRDLAIARLDSDAGNFTELAFELGFADSSAFYKAFKKWTGTTPGQYRALMHPELQPD
ncbi:AraC family transcriptional regulator [Pseudomonas sp. sp1636]|uniref:AraC family transcriptional regulator n=1 Tax=Pseudomonas sp. sp1636 TaxID=3036707 RepID=UPI0025A6045F|nr:AraC family transcriptional regulator [Pseudomonas sp. sp1636]MDM8350225.1 AraC family transcriptional regulator [Pseudomonas sp. sp1636]